MKKIAALEETTRERAATVKSGSAVFSVLPQQRFISAAEEFWVQIHAIGWSLLQSPSKSNHECVQGNSKERFELFPNKLVFSVSVSIKIMILTRHFLIRRAFREKCIFTDYNERVFVFDLIYLIKH